MVEVVLVVVFAANTTSTSPILKLDPPGSAANVPPIPPASMFTILKYLAVTGVAKSKWKVQPLVGYGLDKVGGA